MYHGKDPNANWRRLLSAGNQDELLAFLDKLFNFLLSVDKKSKSKPDEAPKALEFVGEALGALLSNENVLNNRPVLGK